MEVVFIDDVALDEQSMLAYLRSQPGARPDNFAEWKAAQNAAAEKPIQVCQADGRRQSYIPL